MLKALLASMTLLTGCEEERLERRLGGYELTTPMGLKVYWLGASARYPTADVALAEVDRVLVEYLAEFGGPNPYGDNEALEELQQYPILLVPAQRLPADDRPCERAWIGIQIDIAMDCEAWDPWLGRYLVGVEWLKHGWRHMEGLDHGAPASTPTY